MAVHFEGWKVQKSVNTYFWWGTVAKHARSSKEGKKRCSGHQMHSPIQRSARLCVTQSGADNDLQLPWIVKRWQTQNWYHNNVAMTRPVPMQSTKTIHINSLMNAVKFSPKTTAQPTDDTVLSESRRSTRLTAEPKAQKNEKRWVVSRILVLGDWNLSKEKQKRALRPFLPHTCKKKKKMVYPYGTWRVGTCGTLVHQTGEEREIQ